MSALTELSRSSDSPASASVAVALLQQRVPSDVELAHFLLPRGEFGVVVDDRDQHGGAGAERRAGRIGQGHGERLVGFVQQESSAVALPSAVVTVALTGEYGRGARTVPPAAGEQGSDNTGADLNCRRLGGE